MPHTDPIAHAAELLGRHHLTLADFAEACELIDQAAADTDKALEADDADRTVDERAEA